MGIAQAAIEYAGHPRGHAADQAYAVHRVGDPMTATRAACGLAVGTGQLMACRPELVTCRDCPVCRAEQEKRGV